MTDVIEATESDARHDGDDDDRRAGGLFFKVLGTITVMAVGLGLIATLSLAVFTDSESVGGNTFETGTVDIAVAPAVAIVTSANMAPGDQVTAPLTVTNNGTLDLRYAVRSVTTENVLAAELVLTIKSGVALCNNASWTLSGAVLYSGQLGQVAGIPIFGSNVAGADAGDRTLVSGANEVLCANVSLPLASVAQGVTTTATLTFDAEQTVNNP